MAQNSFDCAASNLLCTETSNFCLDDFDCAVIDDKIHQTMDQNLGFEDNRSKPLVDFPFLSEECFCAMAEREREHLPGDDYLKRLREGDLDLGMRREALDWIWKRDKPWTGQLLAVACLSLAIKMEETALPLIVDLQVGEPKFVFEGKTVQRMELLVMSTLNWKAHACTPYSFIDYFLRNIKDDHQLPSESLISRSVQLILSTIKGIDFLEFRPSEIAASVAIYVLGEIQTVDVDKAMSCFIQLEKGRVVKCLQLIKDLTLISGSLNVAGASAPSVPQSPIGVLDAALSYRSDELTVGSCANSSHSSPDTKRRKQDKPSKEDSKS